jgi:hypothetical protein
MRPNNLIFTNTKIMAEASNIVADISWSSRELQGNTGIEIA